MIYPRLRLARDLLTDGGVILVSIGDKELSNIIKILDELYGMNNQVCIFTWKARAKPTNAGNAKFRPQKISDYILVYSKKNPEELLQNVISAKERVYPHEDENGKYRLTTILTSNRGTFRRETMRFESNGYAPDEDFRWKAGKETIDRLFSGGRMQFNDDGTPMEKKYAKDEDNPLYPIYTFVEPELSGTAEHGKSELSSLVGNKHGFDTVKPVELMKYLVSTFSDHNSIVLDFFSGSGTTAQSVYEINAENLDSKRKFILVQIPEKLPEGSEALTAGFTTICDIALMRIKKVGNKLNSTETFTAATLDTGFRVLKLDSTNMQDVYYTPRETVQLNFDNLIDNLKPDRTPEDLLFQVMLDLGIPLSAKIERDGSVFRVNDNYLIACFEKADDTLVTTIARAEPHYAVFRDSSFASDSTLVNFEQIFATYSPTTIRKVL
jgi:adenine-specific DNA-methyltransferase